VTCGEMTRRVNFLHIPSGQNRRTSSL